MLNGQRRKTLKDRGPQWLMARGVMDWVWQNIQVQTSAAAKARLFLTKSPSVFLHTGSACPEEVEKGSGPGE